MQQRDEEMNAIRLERMNEDLNAPYAPEILELSDLIIGDRPPSYITEVLAQPKRLRRPSRPDVSDPSNFLKSNRGSGHARQAPPPPAHVLATRAEAASLSPVTSPGRTERLLNQKAYTDVIYWESPADQAPRFEREERETVWSLPPGELDPSGRRHRKHQYGHIDKKGHNVNQMGGLSWERSLHTGDLR
jgi:hypothetical protein